MKTLKSLCVVFSAAILSSCSSQEADSTGQGETEVTISLEADASHNLKAKSTETDLPDIADFTVEIFRTPAGTRLFRDTYANATSQPIRLNGGDFLLSAFHGDSLKAGFDAAFYQAKVPFRIDVGPKKVNVSGTARLANVKVTVNYGQNLTKYYDRYLSSLSTDKTGMNANDTLTFVSDETRAGYIPAGKLTYRLYASLPGEKMKYFHTVIDATANDFITLNVDTNPLQGKVTIGIVIDNSTDTLHKEITLDPTDASTDKPAFSLSSDLDAGTVEFYEGDNLESTIASIDSKAGFSSAHLDISSEYLKAKGIPESIDLMSEDAAVVNSLSNLGIDIIKVEPDSRFGGVYFGGLSDKMKYEENPFEGSFTLNVTDKNGVQATSKAFSLKMLKSEAAIAIEPGDIYSRSVRGISIDVSAGTVSKYTLQYRKNGGEWTAAEGTEVSGSSINFAKIGGLNPSSGYEFRAIYNGNPANSTQIVKITTENAGQPENADFEDWYHKQVYKKTIWSIGTTGLGIDEWWVSKNTSAYWGTRNPLTTSQRSGVSCYYTSFSGTIEDKAGHTGSAAEISTLGWGEGNTFTNTMTGVFIYNKTAGMLFMGDYDLSAKKEILGRPFSSRPDYLDFWYKFTGIKGEAYKAYIVVENRDGGIITELGRAELTGNDNVSEFKKAHLKINYTNTALKATHMYIAFISSTAEDPQVTNKIGSKGAFDGYSDAKYIGNVLTIDDVELIYE